MKKLRLIVIFCAAAALLAGCWNYREVESLTIVSAMAVDKGRDGYKYHLTFQYLYMSTGSGGETHAELLESDGDTIFDAVRNAITQSRSTLFFCDCKTVILSREIAEEGISPVLDWFDRNVEARITTRLLVCTDNDAGEILKHRADQDEITGFTIARMITSSVNNLGKLPDVQLFELNTLLANEGVEPVLPSIALRVSDTDTLPELQGMAVFKRDRLLGFLDDIDSRYVLAASGQIFGGVILTDVDGQGGNIALDIEENSIDLSFSLVDGAPRMGLHVKTLTNLAEENTADSIVKKLGIEKVQEIAAQSEQQKIQSVIWKVQNQYDSDIFGFGDYVRRTNPAYWKEHGEQWDQIFADLPVDVEVQLEITDTSAAGQRVNE